MAVNAKNVIKPGETDGGIDSNFNTATSSSRRGKNSSAKSSKVNISMSDFMGIKKSDSIDNFYEIDQVIGRGAFGEVVKARHLFSNEERAIKIIEKHKLQQHAILMQLQLQELNILMKAVSYNIQNYFTGSPLTHESF